MKYQNLDYIVRNVIVQLEESSLRRYQTYLQFAIRGAREMGLFGANKNNVKIAYLDMLPNKAVNLPSDYVKYVKIGVCSNGRIVTLGLDDSLCLGANVNECGDPIEIAMTNIEIPDYTYFTYGIPFYSHYHNNQFVEGLFGMGGGFNSRGYYRINSASNQIQFTSSVPNSTIILEYISDGVNPDGTALVPMEAVEYLIAFVHWKRTEAKADTPMNEKLYWRNEAQVKWNNMKHFQLAFTYEEYLDASRQNINSLPRR